MATSLVRLCLLVVTCGQLVEFVQPALLGSASQHFLEYIPVNMAFMIFCLHMSKFLFDTLVAANIRLPISEAIHVPVITGAWVYHLTSAEGWSTSRSAFITLATTLPYEHKLTMAIILSCMSYMTLNPMNLTATDSQEDQSSAQCSSMDPNILCPASSDSVLDFTMPPVIPKSDRELFTLMFDQICNEILADLPTVYEQTKESTEWIRDMLDYTVAGGKMNRGLAAMACLSTIHKRSNKPLTDRDRVKSAALGWCIEFLQAFFLVADDIMDSSIKRRGKDCWYRLNNVKMIAINDSFILESCVYKILKRYCGTDACYPQLLDLFIEVTRQTELGQLMDLTSQPQDGTIDLSRFTTERMTKIMKYKTALYSFYLPVALAMIQAGITDPLLYSKAREVLCIMGEYFQVQDDYLDCYGTPEQIGKIGTDIQDNKCSWLVVTALGLCTPTQKRILQKNYGKNNDNDIDAVKKLYHKLNLVQIYAEYEVASYTKIQRILDETEELPREVFDFLLKKIYKRTK